MTRRTTASAKKICLSVGAVALATLIGFSAYYLTSYYPAVGVEEYLTGEEKKSCYLFDGEGKDNLIIFYPGAKVDEKAYAPILSMLSKKGVDTALVSMPCHMAIFNVGAADAVLSEIGSSYKHVYLMGHSMGGAMAASYAKSHEIDGLIFLAAYTADDLSGKDLSILSIYGDRDGVLNSKKVESGRTLVPDDYTELVISGGNHAGFGSYGKQDGDNDATISATVQWNETVDAILNFVGRTK